MATAAWSFISAALSYCQTLGYHRLQPQTERRSDDQREVEISLFWVVFRLEKGMSLRLGRQSVIGDADITLLTIPNEDRAIRAARIQGQVFDQLYSPTTLPSLAERRARVLQLADEVRCIIRQISLEILVGLSSRSAFVR